MTTSTPPKEYKPQGLWRYAQHYDDYALVQNWAGEKLMGFCEAKHACRILDIGCGTGSFTVRLKERYPSAPLTALDISAQVLALARKKLMNYSDVDYSLEDIEQTSFSHSFDLMASNVSLQWVKDFDALIRRLKRALASSGEVVFSTFGPGTFLELQRALEDVFGRESLISAARFLSEEALRGTLQKHFTRVFIKRHWVSQEYANLTELLRSIKYTGAQGSPRGVPLFWTPETLGAIENVYRKNIAQNPAIHNKAGSFYATYEVLLCRVKGPRG